MKQVAKCPLCEYEWKPRVITPKQCPLCKRYFKFLYIKQVKGGNEEK